MAANAPSDQYLCAFILCVLLIFFLYFEQFLDFRFTRRPYCLFIIVCYRSTVRTTVWKLSSFKAVMAGIAKVVVAYSVCILPPARYFSATLPNKTRHRAGAVCHCIAGAKALPEVCVLAKPLRQRCNWSINLHRRNWQPM